jgi:hypothetical protein
MPEPTAPLKLRHDLNSPTVGTRSLDNDEIVNYNYTAMTASCTSWRSSQDPSNSSTKSLDQAQIYLLFDRAKFLTADRLTS